MRALSLSLLLALSAAGCGPSEDVPPDAPTGDDLTEPTPPETDAPPDTAPSTDTRLTADGWGPLAAGMSRADLVAAVGDAPPNLATGPEPEVCEEFHPVDAPDGVLVMLEDGVLSRVSLINDAVIEAEGGFTVGASAEDVKAAYPDAVVTPHKYVSEPAEYIVVRETAPDAPDARGVLYEVGADGRVTHIRGGGPSIEYVEGCL